MKKKIIAIILAAKCLGSTVSANVYAESVSLEKSYIEEVYTQGTKVMNMDNVIELSNLSDTITLRWSDFTDYNGEDTSSESSLWEKEWTFKIDDEYTLKVCGKTEVSFPDHIYLSDNSKRRIDIRTDDVKSFLNKGRGEDSLSISEDIKEHFRVYETYSDESTKPERRLVQDFKSIMRYYNVPIRFVFTEYDNIEDILASAYATKKYFVVEQQDGSFKYYDEHLSEMKSSGSYLIIPEKAFTAFWDKEFVQKYISSDAEIENIYYLSGEINQMGTAIYYKTSVGDYVYYNEMMFPIEDFCKYQKAISDELAKNPNANGSCDIDISNVMDLSKYELKNDAASSEIVKGDVIGEDSLSINEDIKEHFRVYETYSDENTKPELRLVQDFKSIMRYYNIPVHSAFTEYDNIDDILASKYVLQKLYVVEQQDGSFKYYDEDLTEIKSSSSNLNIPEKAFTAFWDKDFVNKYISSDAELDNIYYLSGESDRMGTAIYYKTTVGDYVYFYHYSIGEKLFSIEDFCKYQKSISDELAKHPNENDGSDIDISSIMDLSKYNLKNITSESESLKGDANCDGQVDLSDAVMIMQSLANPDKYGINGTAEYHLTEQGKLNGDMNGDGLTVGDALAIQRKLLGLVDTLTIQTPPATNSYSYESYSDLNEALIKQDSSILVDSNNYGELFNKTVSAFENKDIDLYVPTIDENVCALRNKEGFSNISLMTAELYNLPWIWYHCNVNDNDIDVKIAYHSVIESSELNSAKTYYEVLKLIAPDAPNPDNFAEFESYQKIYESEITLANGQKVVAMISEIVNSSNAYVMFVYDGMLVSIYANQNALTEAFWNSFSLEKI